MPFKNVIAYRCALQIFLSSRRLDLFAALGVTENYTSFLVLVSFVMDWPIQSTCYERKLHVNRDR